MERFLERESEDLGTVPFLHAREILTGLSPGLYHKLPATPLAQDAYENSVR